MNNTTIIIFGATGDLARRKLFPALYKLVEDKKIDNYSIVGVALEDATVESIFASAESYVTHKDESLWNEL